MTPFFKFQPNSVLRKLLINLHLFNSKINMIILPTVFIIFSIILFGTVWFSLKMQENREFS